MKLNKLFYISLVIITFLFTTTLTGMAANQLQVHFIDVGQGDSILIKMPNEEVMLIDAGKNGEGDDVVNYLRSQGIDTIDYLVGTHPHADHIGGLDDVIKSFKIGSIYMPRKTHTTKTYQEVLLAIQDKGMKINPTEAGKIIVEDDNLKAKILSPITEDYEELNDWSAVIKLTYGNNSFLFTGDIEETVEDQLLSSEFNLATDVLKVSHHGSYSSTTYDFLEAAKPKYGVISVGEGNRYGHPSSRAIKRLKNSNVKLFRTDQQGTIIATSDGDKISFNKKTVQSKKQNKDNQNIKDAAVKIMNVDLHEEEVLIKNTSNQEINLSGWKLLSVKGTQAYFFPQGTILKPGKTIIVASGRGVEESDNVLKWTGAYIWNNDGDKAELYDNTNQLVSEY